MKLIVLDGIDNSGKSTLIKMIANDSKVNLPNRHFPSEKLIKFFEDAKKKGKYNKESFINQLIIEESNVLNLFSEIIPTDIMLIDRMTLSTFLYQVDKYVEDDEMLKYVTQHYLDLFDYNNIDPLTDIHYFIFTKSFENFDDREIKDDRDYFDKKYKEFQKKLNKLVDVISKQSNPLVNKLFSKENVSFFTNNKIEDIAAIQNQRTKLIVEKIEEMKK